MKNIIFILLLLPLFSHEACGFIEEKEDGTLSSTRFNTHKLLVQTVQGEVLPRQSIKVSLDREGFFIDEKGNYLMGYLQNDSNDISRIRVNKAETLFLPTKTIIMALNLSTATGDYTHNITIYDPLATARDLTLQWQKKSPHVWNVAFSCPEAEQLAFDSQPTPLEITFDPAGKENTYFPKNPILTIQWKPDVCNSTSQIAFKDSSVTTSGSASYSNVDQDGVPFGHYTGYQFKPNQNVVVTLSNGIENVIARLTLAEIY